MKKVYVAYMFLLVALGLMQSCCPLNSKVAPTYEKVGTSYVYVNNISNSRLTLLPTGDFVYSETIHEILGEICQCNKGRWYQKKDTVYLTTLFQGDYIVELGDAACDDSVLICIYSLQTGKPTDDFAYVNEKDSIELPTTDGLLCISCTEKESLARQLHMGIVDDIEIGVSLECGKAYKYYIKDCFPIVMREEKFILTDSCLFDISAQRLYHMEELQKRTQLERQNKTTFE